MHVMLDINNYYRQTFTKAMVNYYILIFSNGQLCDP